MKYIASILFSILIISAPSPGQNSTMRTNSVGRYRADVGTNVATFVFPLGSGQTYKWSAGGLTYMWSITVNNNRRNYEFGFSLFTPMGATPEESGGIHALLQAGQCSVWEIARGGASVVGGATAECVVGEDQRSLTVKLSQANSIQLLFSSTPRFVTFRKQLGRFVKPSSVRVPVKYSAAAPSVSAQSRRTQDAELNIGTINNIEKYSDTPCFCWFKSPSASEHSESYIFSVDVNEYPYRVWLNINGRVTALKLVSSTLKNNQRQKKGSSYTETYRSGDITAHITYVVVKEYAEGADYTATVVVTKGNRIKTVKAVGECGC
ncbi:MAG: hypothetical protein AABN95_26950 [Acidobacteriota bacterium]